jgi:hypothetical protein
LGILTVRVPDALKRRLRMFPEVNWSQIVRSALEERVTIEMSTHKAKDKKRILGALRIQDEAARKTAKWASQWSSIEVIRWWRQHRYSSSTPQ